MSPFLTHSNAAMILSHPGHELRVLGWLKHARPLVIVLTDGSGHTNQPRIELSRNLITEAGGRMASLCGNFTDQQFYQAILKQDLKFFQHLQQKITEILIENQIEVVAGDSVEGYNPSHDLCRCLIDRTLADLQKTSGQSLLNFEYPLVEHPAIWSEHPRAYCHRLSAAELEWKFDRIQYYAQAVGGTLLEEIEEALSRFGQDILAEEWFSPSESAMNLSRFDRTPPYYELHGEHQVSVGHYEQTILFKKHMLPLINALGMGHTA